MSATEHNDPSTRWLTFFFVCFAISVFGIGLWALYAGMTHDPNAEPSEPSGGHGMILPGQELNRYPLV